VLVASDVPPLLPSVHVFRHIQPSPLGPRARLGKKPSPTQFFRSRSFGQNPSVTLPIYRRRTLLQTPGNCLTVSIESPFHAPASVTRQQREAMTDSERLVIILRPPCKWLFLQNSGSLTCYLALKLALSVSLPSCLTQIYIPQVSQSVCSIIFPSLRVSGESVRVLEAVRFEDHPNLF
jgi:hypothetical protein